MSEFIISLFLGIGLAASAGFRVFIPLLALSLAAYFNLIPLNSTFSGLGTLTAVICFGVATLIEILAYYIPWVDNLLDTIAVPLAGVAGSVLMASTLIDTSPVVDWVLPIIAGGGVATSLNLLTAGIRATSSATTGGFANPVVSTTETITASTLSVASLLAPLLGFVILLFIFTVFYYLWKILRRKKYKSPNP